MTALRRAHLDRSPVDVDWAAWSVALTEASRPAAAAHLVLLNAIRRSMGRSLADLP
ncbi:hypothetical protein ACN27F_24375 [Solwaraspora sp. WMMB335]|uniref:hypothetical protein n=1 Tax=Solwaraspora sp. WMMB335 TaxID=3404118 RepID=UPI003B9302F0